MLSLHKQPDWKMLVTLWPRFPHFNRFAFDKRLAGIRLNSAMISIPELDDELPLIPSEPPVPMYFDIKGRQLRVSWVTPHEDHLEIRLNHPIKVKTPTPVLFKGGEDSGLLVEVSDDGYGLVFADGLTHGPLNGVRVGESLHIRDETLVVGGSQFVPTELEKIDKVKKFGFTRWFLSYVECQRDVDEFVELVGKDAEVMLKIENKKGLEYVAREFTKRDNLTLVAANGDLFVEVDRPHDILRANELIIEKDKAACAASRMVLSIIQKPVPSFADLAQVGWLYKIGFRNFMLCDEICLKEDLLCTATNVLEETLRAYGH
jgi:hypothetical protein